MKLKKILVVLIALWMGFIFNMSNQNATKSSNTSGKTIEIVIDAVPELKKQPEEVKKNIVDDLQFIVRKSAHFFSYMILGILVGALILNYTKMDKRFLIAWIICILYAMSDEFHQLFVPGRACQLRDVMIDSAGSLLGITIVMFFKWIWSKKRNKNVIKNTK